MIYPAWCIMQYCPDCGVRVIAVHVERYVIEMMVNQLKHLDKDPKHQLQIIECEINTKEIVS